MPKTKKNYKKRRTIRKRKSVRGAGFAEELRTRTRTRRLPPQERQREKRRSITPNKRNIFPASIRNYLDPAPASEINPLSQQDVSVPNGKNITIVYPTGHIYKGDFNEGKKEGTGTFTVKDGPSYTGEWKEDKFVPFTEWKKSHK